MDKNGICIFNDRSLQSVQIMSTWGDRENTGRDRGKQGLFIWIGVIRASSTLFYDAYFIVSLNLLMC